MNADEEQLVTNQGVAAEPPQDVAGLVAEADAWLAEDGPDTIDALGILSTVARLRDALAISNVGTILPTVAPGQCPHCGEFRPREIADDEISTLVRRLEELQPGFDGCVSGHKLAREAAAALESLARKRDQAIEHALKLDSKECESLRSMLKDVANACERAEKGWKHECDDGDKIIAHVCPGVGRTDGGWLRVDRIIGEYELLAEQKRQAERERDAAIDAARKRKQ